MSKTKIYLGVELLDYDGQVNVKRQVNDFRDLNIGSSNKSYTIELPLTRVNRKLLKLPDDVRSKEEVTDNARIVTSGIELLKGKLRILNTTRQVARVLIEGDDWIDDLKGLILNQPSWPGGSYNHTFTAANVKDSWTAAAGAFYRYPLINWGELYSEDHQSGAKLYPYDFYPMFNVAGIVEFMLSEVNYQLAANGFFASTQGLKMYLLARPNPAPDDFILEKGLSVYVDDDEDNWDSHNVADDALFSVAVNQVLDINGETTDEGNDFSADEYSVPATGTYRFQAQITVESSGNDDGSGTDMVTNNITWSIRNNGTPIESYTLDETAAPEPTQFDGAPAFTLDTGWIHCEYLDDIDIHVNIEASGYNRSGGARTFHLRILDGAAVSFLVNTWDERNLWPGIGKTIAPYTHMPGLNFLDLLVALKEIFNLRFFMDRQNRTIYIEESNDFYGSTEVDWSDKIDYSDPPKMEIIAANYKEYQTRQYKGDAGDRAYTDFIAASEQGAPPFWDTYQLTSEYKKAGRNTIVNLFASTITEYMSQIAHYGTSIPRIFGGSEFKSDYRRYPLYRAKTWENRILTWEGLYGSIGQWYYHEDVEDDTGDSYSALPKAVTYDMEDAYDHWQKDYRRINENKILTCTLKLTPAEIGKFVTVVGTAANEGFRATYKMNVEGQDMYFICTKIITDGDRVRGEFIQKI